MPAAEPLPSIQEFVNAFQGALVSESRYADTHEGAVYDHWNGLGAILWRRMAERDQQEYQALYFNSARGSRLDTYIENHFPGKARVPAQKGQGTVRLRRPSAAAGAGTFLAKTRIAVASDGPVAQRYYQLTDDQACAGTDLVLTLNIEAAVAGPDSRIHVFAGERPILRVEDPLWDNTWVVEELACEAGTFYEEDDPARTRIKAELFEERFGYEAAIIKAMNQAGAQVVALFRSDYLGEQNDHGLNLVCVGDANFETSPELLRDCRLALPSAAIAGAGNQVLPITTNYLNFAIRVRFWDSPEKFGMAAAKQAARAAVVEYFETRDNPFTWDSVGVEGAIRRAVEDTQQIDITPSEDPPALDAIFSAYPVRRFRTTPERVAITLDLPSG